MQNPEDSKLMRLIGEYDTLSWQEGILVGQNGAAEYLIELSGQYFVKCEDQKAQWTRQLGIEAKRRKEDREKEERPKREKRKKELYDEMIEILKKLVETEKENSR